MIRTSYSQLSKFGTCPTQWDISTRWKPKEDSMALILGQAFHAAAARAYAQGNIDAGNKYLEALCGSVDQSSDAAKSLHTMWASYRIFADKVLPGDLARFNVLGVETETELELAGSGVVVAVIDLIVEDRASKVKYVVDHKYKADFDDGLPERDDQGTIYSMSLFQKYQSLLPMIYNVVRKPLYKIKQGETPAAFGARTYTTMAEEEIAFKYNATSYKSRFFVREIYSRGALHVRESIARIRSQMMVMEWIKNGKGKAWLAPGDHCRWCSVRALCPVEDSMVARSLFVPKGQDREHEAKTSE